MFNDVQDFLHDSDVVQRGIGGRVIRNNVHALVSSFHDLATAANSRLQDQRRIFVPNRLLDNAVNLGSRIIQGEENPSGRFLGRRSQSGIRHERNALHAIIAGITRDENVVGRGVGVYGDVVVCRRSVHEDVVILSVDLFQPLLQD